LARANPNGTANRNTITLPWIVNTLLYVCSETTCRPGRASSARMIPASAPPMARNTSDVTA
jgi:hypothetical protein